MAEIVNSLFGSSPAQIRQQEDAQNLAYGREYANTYTNPYDRADAQRGALVGSALLKFGSKLFGLESPELKRATTLESILQQTTQEVGSQDPAVLYPELARRLSSAGFTREALQVGAVGDKAKRESFKEASDMMYKDSMSKYYNVLQANQELALEAKQLEQQGQVAYGALQAYKGIAEPEGKTRVWNTALDALAKKGVEVEKIRDIPYEQREATLDQIVNSSDTAALRMKEEIAQMTNEFKIQKQQQDLAMKQQSNDLKAAIANLQAQVKQEQIGSAREIAMNKQIDTFGNQLKLLQIKERNDTQAQYSSAIGTKEFNKEITSYLKEDVGLSNPDQIKSALTEFNTLYKNYLGQKDSTGLPVYDNITALNMAKKAIEGKVGSEESFFGLGKPKATYSGKAVTPKVIKLD